MQFKAQPPFRDFQRSPLPFDPVAPDASQTDAQAPSRFLLLFSIPIPSLACKTPASAPSQKPLRVLLGGTRCSKGNPEKQFSSAHVCNPTTLRRLREEDRILGQPGLQIKTLSQKNSNKRLGTVAQLADCLRSSRHKIHTNSVWQLNACAPST